MSPATSPMSSRTAFTLLVAAYSNNTLPLPTYSLSAVSLLLLQLLGLETLLSSTSNAFPRSLHGDCLFCARQTTTYGDIMISEGPSGIGIVPRGSNSLCCLLFWFIANN